MTHSSNKRTIYLASLSQLTSEQQLCFSAAVCCMVLGTIGWGINYFNPGATSLDAMLVVGVFYLFNAGLAAWKNRASESQPTPSSETVHTNHSVDADSKQRDAHFRDAA